MDNPSDVTWQEVVREALTRLDAIAPLAEIYALIEGHAKTTTNPTWRATVRRTLQQYATFQPVEGERGVWRLTQLPEPAQSLSKDVEQPAEDTLDHSSTQGMLLNLGRLYSYETYAPSADCTMRYFGDRPLSDFATVRQLPQFSTSRVMEDVKFVDVIWLRGDTDDMFPHFAFEVEHSRDMKAALLRLYQFHIAQLRTQLFIVAPSDRIRKFESEAKKPPFLAMLGQCAFRSYAELLALYDLAVRHTEHQRAFLSEQPEGST